MRHPSLTVRFAFSAVSLALLAAVPAAAETPLQLAQVYPYPYSAPPGVYRGLSPNEAMSAVRSLGLTPTSARSRGSFWVVQAVGRDGTPVRVAVDRWSGRVVDIQQVGPRPPHVARVVPGAPYERAPGGPTGGQNFDDDDEDGPPLPPANVPGGARGGSFLGPYSGAPDYPRDGIRSNELPPPGTGPRVISRDGDITNTVPQRPSASAPGAVDPLLGVPPEFRGGQGRGEAAKEKRLARQPGTDAGPRATPLPRPRPTDLARREEAPDAGKPSAPVPNKDAETKAAPAAADARRSNSPAWPPVQPLE
jgi:hypothetical protein